MPVSDVELSTLAASHDIISLGMRADDRRRELHGNRTTFLRVADVAAGLGSPVDPPQAAGEIRIVGMPASRNAARHGWSKSWPHPGARQFPRSRCQISSNCPFVKA